MKKRKRIHAVIYHVFMAAFCLIMIYPVLWMVFSSFKPTSDIFVTQKQLFPENWTIENYINGWRGFAGYSFRLFFRNSLFITVVSTIGTLITSALAAYAFARLKFPFKKVMFALMMMTLMLPAQVMMIPQYILYNWFGWIGSFNAVIIPSFAGGAFYIYMLVQFIQGLPRELDEAAIMDGCNRYSIFFRIILPLLKPSVITAAIFAFYWKWEDFLGPLLYLSSPKKYTVSLALKLFSDPSQASDWGALFAMASLSLLPVIIIFFLFQKYIVEGVATTGIKG